MKIFLGCAHWQAHWGHGALQAHNNREDASFLSPLNPGLLLSQVDSYLHRAGAASFLFGEDECLVGSYASGTITSGRHFKHIYDTAGSLDFLCCSYYDDLLLHYRDGTLWR